MASRGRKDAIPGADGSTTGGTGTTIPIYGASGEKLSEDGNGFGKVDIASEGVINGTNSQVYAIKNPLTFIYSTANLGDWYTDNETYQDNTLWGEEDMKSEFDPCPKGWRLPTEGSWGDFSTVSMILSGSNNIHTGRTYTQMVWFPMSGAFHYNRGTLESVGKGGYSWSASGNNVNSMSLAYSTNNVYPSLIYYRAYGFAIRCVQE